MPKRPPLLMIPVVAAVGGVTQGCGEPLIGDWTIRALGGTALPSSSTYYGTTFTKTATLSVEADKEAELTVTYTRSGDESGVESYVYQYVWRKMEARTYWLRNEDGFTLECGLRADELECDVGGERLLEARRDR